MATYVGLLRAINLAGKNSVSMDALRDVATELGLQDARTLLQSGNIVFRSNVSSADKLERLLQNAALHRLGVTTEFFIRTAAEWNAIVAANPFAKEAKSDPARLVAVVFKSAPDRAAVTNLQNAIKGPEKVIAKGREAFITYPDGQGRSKLTIALIEKKLGTRGTARNWNTVLKLAAVTEGM